MPNRLHFGKTLLVVVTLLVIPFAARAADTPFISNFGTINTKIWSPSHGWTNGEHQSCEWNRAMGTTRNGRLTMTLAKRGGKLRPYACSELQTLKKLGYGKYEVRLKTAAGSGLNTAFFTYIGPPMGVRDHDEIDFEFLGKNPRTVELTHWTAGKSYPGGVIDLGFDTSVDFHNYAFVWTPASITWSVDGKEIYQTPPGTPLPTNPQKLMLSLWSGNKSNKDWLGPFTYTKPVTAEVLWVKYTPIEP